MESDIVFDDYYAILGVTATADDREIRTAYYRLARHTHPDKNSRPDGKEQFQKLQAAYETLSDSTKRKIYDTVRPGSEEGRLRLRMLEEMYAKMSTKDNEVLEARQKLSNLEAEIAQLEEEEKRRRRDYEATLSSKKSRKAFLAMELCICELVVAVMVMTIECLKNPQKMEEELRRQEGAARQEKEEETTQQQEEQNENGEDEQLPGVRHVGTQTEM
ncbi:DnaJ domain-containing protein [Xylaria bambusicola]|uniref:DnaJ domain-containing protein n=1 Tax=Xylaria bambusicola TaxID=326684 RepID=UPI002007596A|nr:DnaJ domain-containing protein [Xylaria bambusicola]KAI0515178.1 DnaJ domain-containing protein [Xylaria bambusicola]